jgi:hypothetical protein
MHQTQACDRTAHRARRRDVLLLGCGRKASIMGALRFVGLAILTAVAPIAVVIGSSPAHADPQEFGNCSPEGAKTWTPQAGGLVCEKFGDDPVRGGPLLQWMQDPDVIAHCVDETVCGHRKPPPPNSNLPG